MMNQHNQQDKLWYICTICYQAFEDEAAKHQTHRKLAHPSSAATKLVLLLNQHELDPTIKLKRCRTATASATTIDKYKQNLKLINGSADKRSSDSFRTCIPKKKTGLGPAVPALEPVPVPGRPPPAPVKLEGCTLTATTAAKSAITSTNDQISSTSTVPTPPAQPPLELKSEILTLTGRGSCSGFTPVILDAGTLPDPSTLTDGKIRCRICFHEFRTKSNLNTHFLLKHVPKEALNVSRESQPASSTVKPDPGRSPANTQQGFAVAANAVASSSSTEERAKRRKKTHGEEEHEKAKKAKATTAHVQVVLGNQSESLPKSKSRKEEEEEEEDFLQKGKAEMSRAASPPPLIWVRAAADLLEPEEQELDPAQAQSSPTPPKSVELEHRQVSHWRTESQLASPGEPEIIVLPLPPSQSHTSAADQPRPRSQPQPGPSKSSSVPSGSGFLPLTSEPRHLARSHSTHQNTFTRPTPSLSQECRRPLEPIIGAMLEPPRILQPEASGRTGTFEIFVQQEHVQPLHKNQPTAAAAAPIAQVDSQAAPVVGITSGCRHRLPNQHHNTQSISVGTTTGAGSDFRLIDILTNLPTRASADYFSAVRQPSRICNASSEGVGSLTTLTSPDTGTCAGRKKRTQDPSIDEEANKLPFPAHQLSCQYCGRVLDTLAQLDEHISQSHGDRDIDRYCHVCLVDLCLPGAAGGGSTASASASIHNTSRKCRTCGQIATADLLRMSQYFLNFHEEEPAAAASHAHACTCVDLTLYTHAELKAVQYKKKTSAPGEQVPAAGAPLIKCLKERSCHTCKLHFSSTFEYRNHFMEAHALPREWICDICLRQFNSQSGLLNHQEQALGHAKYQRYECDKCRMTKHVCGTCRREFGGANALENHQKNKGGPCFKGLPLAPLSFGTGRGRSAATINYPHQRPEAQSFRCYKCPLTLPSFSSAAEFEYHRLTCKSSNAGPSPGPKCTYCGLEFGWIFAQIVHERLCPYWNKRGKPAVAAAKKPAT